MAEPVLLRPKRACPICKKASQRPYHPFCSSRCAQVDLNRWFGGQYVVPTNEAPDNSDTENSDESV